MDHLLKDPWDQKTAPRAAAQQIIKKWLVKQGLPDT